MERLTLGSFRRCQINRLHTAEEETYGTHFEKDRIKRGVYAEEPSVSVSPRCNIVIKENYDSDKDKVSNRKSNAIKHLRELSYEPVEGLRYQEPADEEDTEVANFSNCLWTSTPLD